MQKVPRVNILRDKWQSHIIPFLLVIAVVVAAKAFELPVRWYADRGPRPAVAAGGAEELPRHRVIFPMTGEVYGLRFLWHAKG